MKWIKKREHQIISGLTPTTVLQLEAVKRGQGELALLFPSKQPVVAAKVLAKLKQEDKDAEMLRYLKLQNSHHQMRLDMMQATQMLQPQPQSPYEATPQTPEPAFILPKEEEEHSKVDLDLKTYTFLLFSAPFP